MARRRNRTAENAAVSEEQVLERAREQAQAQMPASSNLTPTTDPAQPIAPTTGKSRTERRAEQGMSGTRRYTTTSTRTGEPPRLARTTNELSAGEIEILLANPTKVVTEAELHQQYGYVLADLRNMGLLAAGLFAVLIVLALFFVR